MGASCKEPIGPNTGTGEMVSPGLEHTGQESAGSNTGTGEMVSPPENECAAASTSAAVDENEAVVSPVEALTLRGTLDRSVDLRNPSGSGNESETDWVDVVHKQISLKTWGVTSNPYRLIPGTAKLIRGVPQSLPVEERAKLRIRQDPAFRRACYMQAFAVTLLIYPKL